MSSACLSLGLDPDGRGAVLSGASPTPVSGRLDWTTQDARACEPKLPTGLLGPDADPRAAAAERQAAAALGRLLGGGELEPVRLALARLEGASADRPALALDLREPTLAALPWELLETLPVGSAPLAGWSLMRQHASLAPRPLAPGRCLELLTWLPVPEDPVCAPLADALPDPVVLGTDLVSPPPVRGGFRVLHVLCHGVAALDQVSLALGPRGQQAPDTVASRLAPLLQTVQLVVLDVCGAGSPTPVALAARLLDSGVGGCLGPARELGVEASRAFHRSFYEALAAGQTVLAAVSEGRRALRALALAHASCRWWNPLLHAGDRAGLVTTVPIPVIARPPGWALGDADHEAVLVSAWAGARSDGWLGVSHLLRACGDVLDGGPSTALQQVADTAPRLTASVDLPRPSPRVRALASASEPGDTLDVLLCRLVTVPWVAARLDPGVLADLVQVGDRWATAPAPGSARPPVGGRGLVLEVWGGPEDGRQLRLEAAGQQLGRWAPGDPAQHTLYEGGGLADRNLSRRHLQHEGGRRVRALAPAILRGAQGDRRLEVAVLRPGDRIVLGVTVLEAR